ncbi:hypothetical protein OHR68_39380 [Spirillospora sp. NBC_00431]
MTVTAPPLCRTVPRPVTMSPLPTGSGVASKPVTDVRYTTCRTFMCALDDT